MKNSILFLFVMLLAVYLFVYGKTQAKHEELPQFLKSDIISDSHETRINLSFSSIYKPTEYEQQLLISDYSNIWAHLNHLYGSNDIHAGLEYYTEDFFKHLCTNPDPIKTNFIRKDHNHNLNIVNWSNDGLLCTVIDHDVLLSYTFNDQSIQLTKATIAMVLVFQGDHWRIDALKFLNEDEITNLKKQKS